MHFRQEKKGGIRRNPKRNFLKSKVPEQFVTLFPGARAIDNRHRAVLRGVVRANWRYLTQAVPDPGANAEPPRPQHQV